MENYYTLLGIDKDASLKDIKRAFRERAKRLHPDIAGKHAETEMRRLLAAYHVLSSRERRFAYDRAGGYFSKSGFNYRSFLKKRGDPESLSKLIFFDFLHFEDDEAVKIWLEGGALDFHLEKYLEREDWMDCSFILAEELYRRGRIYEAFMLLAALVKEERNRPYFRHFMGEIENFLKEIVRTSLKTALDRETYASCLQILLGLGFSPRLESGWLVSLAETMREMGENRSAETLFREAIRRNPAISHKKRVKTG